MEKTSAYFYKLMNGGNLEDSKFVDDMDHCEITYYFVYYPDKNKVFAYYGIAGKTYETKNKLSFKFANTLMNDKNAKE